MNNDITIRPIREDEYNLLKKFLYLAIFRKDDTAVIPPEIVETPELRIYFENFGCRAGDIALCAETTGEIIGLVWVRNINGFGYVDTFTPELAISLTPDYRNSGIGGAMMKSMLELLRINGCKQCSLSVQKDNFAAKWYGRLGFRVVKETEDEAIMLYRFA